MRYVPFILVLLSASLGIAQSASERLHSAVVTITIRTADNQLHQGSGFFISQDGDLLTCYHVIEGARSIEVKSGDRTFYRVNVVEISPFYDLAHLRLKGNVYPRSFLAVSDTLPSNFDNLVLDSFGDPAIVSDIHLKAHATSPSFMDWSRFKEPGTGAWIFKQHLDLIGVTMEFFDGVSGAPLIANGTAVGVISGSYQQGGTLGWAIPVKYRSKMQSIALPPELVKWPALSLLADVQWRPLRRSVSLNRPLSDALDHYAHCLDTFQGVLPAILTAGPGIVRTIDAEIKLYGPNQPLASDRNLPKLMQANYSPEAQEAMARFFGGDDDLSDALNDLADQVDDYFRRLPATDRNRRLESKITSSLKTATATSKSDPFFKFAQSTSGVDPAKITLSEYRGMMVRAVQLFGAGGSSAMANYFQSYEDIVESLFQTSPPKR